MTPLNHKQNWSRPFKDNRRYKKDMHTPIYATGKSATATYLRSASCHIRYRRHLIAYSYATSFRFPLLEKQATASLARRNHIHKEISHITTEEETSSSLYPEQSKQLSASRIIHRTRTSIKATSTQATPVTDIQRKPSNLQQVSK